MSTGGDAVRRVAERLASPEVQTWADGFGNWHARTEKAFDAWWAIRAEHIARDNASGPAMRECMKVREVEPGVWVEWWPSYDARDDHR